MTLTNRYDQAMMNLFGTPKRVFDHGQGVYVTDVDGKTYLDLLAGIAVNALGYAHPVQVAALAAQASKMMHVSNFFASVPQIELAEKLKDMLTAEGYVGSAARVFFANSGAEANEGAIKLARTHKPGGRIVALNHGFHGRTLGALSITEKPRIREPFEPLPGNVTFVDPEASALEAVMADDVAALFVETIQGEAGVEPISSEFLTRARELCDRFGALLVVDEVQTGMGRTGRWFAHSAKVKADVITLAKGLGGGFPIGAVIGIGRAGRLLTPGSHGSTFAGSPLATATALATLGETEKLMGHVKETGDWLAGELRGMGFTVRGAGLLLGIAIENAPAVVDQLLEEGFIVNAPNESTIRIAPPLIITKDELTPFLAAMKSRVSK